MPLELNNFRVHIECDGKALPQYQVKQADNKTIRCYIPSEAGKNFSIVASLVDLGATTPYDGFVADLWAEGKLVTGKGRGKEDTLKINYVRVGSKSIRPLVFSAIQTTDHEDIAADVTLSDIGLLEIRAHFAHKKPAKRQKSVWSDLPDARVVSERSKKAGFNVTGLGDSISVLALSPHVDVYAPVKKNPDAIFQFYHQPLDRLVAAGIVSRTEARLAQTPKSESARTASKRSLVLTPQVPGNANKRRKLHDADIKAEPSDNGDNEEELATLEAEVRAAKLKLERIAAEEDLERKMASLAKARQKARKSSSSSKHRPAAKNRT